MPSLSILIPARNEMFLARTVEDILAHAEGDTEVIVICDGTPASPPVPEHPRVMVVTLPRSIGQRAAINLAARMSTAKYVMKVDAHCAFDQGFDVKLMADMQDDWTVVPIMRNLHAFDWVCPNGHRRYQSPSGPCKVCGEPTTMDVVWISKNNPQSKSYCFDAEPHFQYFRAFSKRPEGKGDLTETMSLQGSCWMLTREKYWELEVCDEAFGSWGSQGIEVAVKTWLSGGRVICNQKTWYAHLFRTQGADFGFPYTMSGQQVEHAKTTARQLFFENRWPKQVKPLSWLVEKFWPVPGWADADLAALKGTVEKAPAKGMVYYTDSRIDRDLGQAVRTQVERYRNGHDLVSVSLKPLDFGRNIVFDAERSILTMFRQILAGLEASTADVIFFIEHDVLYHPSHFEFTPPRRDLIYYNLNVWQVRTSDGHALYYEAKRTSQLCAYRDLLLAHYRKRVAMVEANGFTRAMGFEPGTHHRPERVDDLESGTWMSEQPNLDLKHGKNLTPTRWRQDQFRSQRNCRGWREADTVPGWPRLEEVLHDLVQV